MEKIKHILILLSLMLCFGNVSGQEKPNINLVCDVEGWWTMHQFGDRLWIVIDFDTNKFMITSHKQIERRGDVLFDDTDLEIFSNFYKGAGWSSKLNRTSLVYDGGKNFKAYCKTQSQKEILRDVNQYLRDFKSKRKI